MGLFDAMTSYAHKSELRESKDEIVCGELIRGLSHKGWRCFRIVADSDRQVMGFKLPGDPVLSAVYIMVDRKSGSGAVSATMGSRTVIGFTAEMRNKVSDPDDLALMWKTDFANLFKMPIAGEVRVNHQLNTVNARTYHVVNLDDYVKGSTVTVGPLVDWTTGQVDALRERLRPLKK
ncbi:MAG: hypothetical protein QG597_1087 [Actinomycetota bacterium]|nr:hypothetical protein [Actinomycetota bacterium]